MTENVENLLLEMLKKIQNELAANRDRQNEMLSRLSHIEVGLRGNRAGSAFG